MLAWQELISVYQMNNSWRSIYLLLAGIAIALLAAELVIRQIHNEPPKRQVMHGLQELQDVPHVLAVSSSHGRSFHVLGQQLAKRSANSVNLTAVALESGKVEAMEWVLRNRVEPLLLDASGNIKKPLTHLLFGITWWDTCREDDGSEPSAAENASNVVTHGWSISEYRDDFIANGATDLNRNFVRNRWRQGFSASALVRLRFAIKENFGRFTNFLRVSVLGGLPDSESQGLLANWHDTIDNGHECFLSDRDMEALNRFVAFADKHELDLTIVLFPLKPDTITAIGLNNTIKPFTERVFEYGQSNGVRVLDMTLNLLDDGDFMMDLDHVNPSGNLKWSEAILDGEMDFLLDVVNSEALK